MEYQVMIPNDPPETGYRPRGKPHDSRQAAIEAAEKLARGKEVAGRTMLIEASDGVEVISVAFQRGEVLGVDEDTDEVHRAPGQIVITSDSRFQPTKLDKETGVTEVGDERGDVKVVTKEVPS